MSNIYEAITAIMSEVDAISKTKKNKEQGFMFRGIDDVYNMLHPLLSRFGVFSIPEVLEERTEERKTSRGGNLIYRMLKMKYTFFATDSSSVSAIVIGEGMDSGDKASNKAMAVAHKYALIQIFSIPTAEMASDDPDYETPPPSVPAPRNKATQPAVNELDEVMLETILQAAIQEGLITADKANLTMDKAKKVPAEKLPVFINQVEKSLEALREGRQ